MLNTTGKSSKSAKSLKSGKKKTSEKRLRSLVAEGFYSDYYSKDMLYAVLVRSPAATGKFKSLTVPELPEGYHLYLASDIPGQKKVDINKTQVRVFGFDNILYSGEPLGILCGPDEKKLREIQESISVNFDVKSLEAALKKAIKHQKRPIALTEISEGAPVPEDLSAFVTSINDLPSLDTVVDNTRTEENTEKVVAEREIKTGRFTETDPTTAFTEFFDPAEVPEEEKTDQDIICTETWKQNIKAPNWKETAGAYCTVHGDNVHIYTPTNWTYSLIKTVSSVLDIPPENVFIHKTKSTGIFSKGIWRTSIIAAQVALASFLSRKTVKLVLSQEEQDTFMTPGPDVDITYQTRITQEGVIKALSVFISIDVGAYNPFAQEIADRLAIAACNYYRPENLHIIAKAKTSKNPPSSISIKITDSQSFFAIENHIQKLAELINVFPDEIRRLNTGNKIPDYPIQIVSAPAFNTFDSAVKVSDFKRKYASFHMDAIDRIKYDTNPFFALPLRGIGIASAFNNSGYNGVTAFAYNPKVEVVLTEDEKVEIHCIQSSALVHEIWKNTAAEILDLPVSKIKIVSTFTEDDMPESPEESYNTIGTINELIKKCCNDIQKKRSSSKLPLSSKKNSTSATKKIWDKEKFSGTPYKTTSFATTVVEVELDTYTYNEKIKGIWISIDCGEILDISAAKKAILLDIQQELSLLVEGKTVTCDKISINFLPSESNSGQLHELVHNTLPAAFSAALSSALATQLTELPCTEKQIFELIKEREVDL